MGASNSKQSIEQTFNFSALNQTMSSYLSSNSQKVGADALNMQSLTVSVKKLDGCVLDISQKIDSNVVTNGEMSVENLTEMANQVQNDITASMDAAMEKVTEAGNMQFSADNQETRQTTNTDLKNIVATTFSKENYQEIKSQNVNIQKGNIEIGFCKDGRIDYTQDIVASTIATAMLDDLSKRIESNTNLNKLAASYSAAVKAEAGGLEGIIGALTGPYMYAMIASVVCCCCVVLLIMVIGLSSGGQNALSAAPMMYRR